MVIRARNRAALVDELVELGANRVGDAGFELSLENKSFSGFGRGRNAAEEFVGTDTFLTLGVDDHRDTVDSRSALRSDFGWAGAYLRVISAQKSANSFTSFGGDV